MKRRFTRFAVVLVCFGLWAVGAHGQTDVTDTYLSNPSFEDSFTDWESSELETQTNSSFSLKDEDTYVEKWTSWGSEVGDGYVKQTIDSLPNGVYQLTVSAQNIQQGSTSKAQSGAYIFADDAQAIVTTTNTYTLDFTVLEATVTVGFVAEGATGNWIACDNFQLYFVSDSLELLLAELAGRIESAQALAGEKMQTEVLSTLTAAIEAAQAEYEAATGDSIAKVAVALREAVEASEEAVEAYANLDAGIEEALEVYDADKEGADDFLAAIEEAQSVTDNLSAANDELIEALSTLETATLAFRLANGTGTVPTVVTDTRHARGATMAFGRSTITGVDTDDLLEHGFCYSTDPEPTILDSRSTEYLENNGYIYVMRDLTPATIYYIRAYALTTDYAVGYGDAIKVVTVPKGNISWTYNNGAGTAANERINNALEEAVDYWNNLTSISGLHISCTYGSSTSTADCSYGGSMRIGPNSAYQATGTVLHEMGHAIGVGTHSVWTDSDSPMRGSSGSGKWLGDRANEALKFWDNDETTYLTGDGTHMWPYGINGADEDDGTEVLYIGNSIITQGLGEDGLPPTGGFCTPAYVLDQEDDIKYYIKTEDAEVGLYTSYLTSNAGGSSIKLDEMTAEEAAADDYAAWYITFNPATQYYSFKNAGNGYYLSYNESRDRFIATSVETPTSTERFHVMKGRVDVTVGTDADSVTTRGYWIIVPEETLNPNCLGVTSAGRSTVDVFDLGNSATDQRWVILAADEIETFEAAATSEQSAELDSIITWVKELAATPHTEDSEGIDAALEATLSDIETRAADSTLSISDLASLIDETMAAAMDFLAEATPESVEEPFDLTNLLSDASLEDGDGWSETPTINYSCGEFYQMTFDMHQTVSDLPAGTYEFLGQAFQRPGTTSSVYSAWESGTNNVNALIYAGDDSEKIQNIMEGAQSKKLGGTESSVGDDYVPNDMEAASCYFEAGLYDNSVLTELDDDDSSLKVGLKCTSYSTSYWSCFDNFRLNYYGSMTADYITTGIEQTIVDGTQADGLFSTPADIYTLSGVCVRKAATSLDGLARGIYIVGSTKVVVK